MIKIKKANLEIFIRDNYYIHGELIDKIFDDLQLEIYSFIDLKVAEEIKCYY